jgi:hypothetical protein
MHELLLDLFRPVTPGRPDAVAREIWSLDVTDIPDTFARYLRCVYETAPVLSNRWPKRLTVAWDSTGLP